jgi:hypothetical protein
MLLETRKTFSSHCDLYLYVDCTIENGKLKLKRAITDSSLESGPMRGVFSRYIGPGPGEPRSDL